MLAIIPDGTPDIELTPLCMPCEKERVSRCSAWYCVHLL